MTKTEAEAMAKAKEEGPVVADWLKNLRERSRESRSSAVRLFCIDCMGGSRGDARSCDSRECALWPHAFGRGKAK